MKKTTLSFGILGLLMIASVGYLGFLHEPKPPDLRIFRPTITPDPLLLPIATLSGTLTIPASESAQASTSATPSVSP